MKLTKIALSMMLAFSIVCLVSMPQMMEHESKWAEGPIGEASAVNTSRMLSNINTSIEDWVPMIVLFTLIGVAMGALIGSQWTKR